MTSVVAVTDAAARMRPSSWRGAPIRTGSTVPAKCAGKLGPNRAYLYSEDEGRLKKFRPYGLPPEEWLAWEENIRVFAAKRET